MGKMAPGLGPLASDFRGGLLVATKAEEPVGSGLWDGPTDWPTRVGSSTSVLRGAQQGAMRHGQFFGSCRVLCRRDKLLRSRDMGKMPPGSWTPCERFPRRFSGCNESRRTGRLRVVGRANRLANEGGIFHVCVP
jgi:hypothetical protein